MDFQSAMETFAEAWVVANAKNATSEPHQSEALSLTCSPTSPADRNLKQVPPAMFGKDPAIDVKHSTDKSLPVHCIVETISSLEEDREPWRRKAHVETDSYVIIPVNTPIQELLLVALTRLGYPKETAAASKGAVLLRNWKPLPLDAIAPNPLVTVGELLGELSNVTTLRIQILRPRPSLVNEMKDKLLKLLLIQSHGLLLRSGCPLDTLTLSNLCRDGATLQHVPEPSEELRVKFEAWVSAQLSPGLSPPFPGPITRIGAPRKDPDGVQSPLQAQLAQKTRMRTSFDPELELPKLQKWFQENQHPSRQQIQQYVKELNSLDCRRGRKPLDMNNVVYWFKNARAAQKRAELRGFCSPLFNMPVNGFQGFHNSIRRNTEQQSPSEDELSRASDTDSQQIDVNDSDAEMPLSLTTGSVTQSESGHDQTRVKDEMHDEHTKREKYASPINIDQMEREEVMCPRSPVTQNGDQNVEETPRSSETAEENYSDEEETHDDGRSSLDLRKNCIDEMRSPSPANGGVSRLPPGFPIVPNSMFSHSIMYMSHYMPGIGPLGPRDPALLLSPDERRKRNRTFIDPVTEVPRLEQWFSLNTHPSHNMILKYTEELNRMPYRQKFPRLEPKNVQFWFKNRRAKCKRLKMSLFDGPSSHYPPN